YIRPWRRHPARPRWTSGRRCRLVALQHSEPRASRRRRSSLLVSVINKTSSCIRVHMGRPVTFRKLPGGVLFHKWQLEHSKKTRFCRSAIGRNADCDLFLRNLESKASVQPVPERESARPVGVGVLADSRMMDAVHARRYNQEIQTALYFQRQ